jgi:hypothetical protein
MAAHHLYGLSAAASALHVTGRLFPPLSLPSFWGNVPFSIHKP